ncbi:MAG: response regulator, partial [Deltaproteobacteria bacterium]|nr:response regulator [Deltaproteobacteria bacterium]
AHDFNNILSAVIGYAQLVLDDVPKGTRMERNMQEVLNAGRRAKDLVKQILAFSREGAEAPLPIQLKPIVKEVLKLLRASLPSTIEIRENIKSDSIVQADPTQIHQVMMNLCANAAYAMQGKGGVLEVDLEDVDLDTVSADQYGDIGPGQFVRLCVCDTGRGMMPEVIERIFDPFFTTKERGEGTGMGLAVVHGIVKDYGGTITVSSEPGKGSTFHVYLPIVEAQVAEGFDADDTSVRGGNERILFVDDERPILESNKLILEHCGYHVTISESSIEALKLFASNPDRFDVVITDMTMPKMTGAEMAMEMIRIRPGLAVILCTGFSDLVTEEKAKAAGIRAFVMKPLLKGKLLSTIRQVLEKS